MLENINRFEIFGILSIIFLLLITPIYKLKIASIVSLIIFALVYIFIQSINAAIWLSLLGCVYSIYLMNPINMFNNKEITKTKVKYRMQKKASLYERRKAGKKAKIEAWDRETDAILEAMAILDDDEEW